MVASKLTTSIGCERTLHCYADANCCSADGNSVPRYHSVPSRSSIPSSVNLMSRVYMCVDEVGSKEGCTAVCLILLLQTADIDQCTEQQLCNFEAQQPEYQVYHSCIMTMKFWQCIYAHKKALQKVQKHEIAQRRPWVGYSNA